MNPQVEDGALAIETIASFIGATHSLRSFGGVSGENEIISALLEHSKNTLETVDFVLSYHMPLPARSLRDFQKLSDITLPARQLVRKFNKLLGSSSIEWVDLLNFLPP